MNAIDLNGFEPVVTYKLQTVRRSEHEPAAGPFDERNVAKMMLIAALSSCLLLNMNQEVFSRDAFFKRLIETYGGYKGMRFTYTVTFERSGQAVLAPNLSEALNLNDPGSLRYEVVMDHKRFLVREFNGEQLASAMWGDGTMRGEYSNRQNAWTSYETREWPVYRKTWPLLLKTVYPRRLAETWVGPNKNPALILEGLGLLMSDPDCAIECTELRTNDLPTYRITATQTYREEDASEWELATLAVEMDRGTMLFRGARFEVTEYEGEEAAGRMTIVGRVSAMQLDSDLNERDFQFNPPTSAIFVKPDDPRFLIPVRVGQAFPQLPLEEIRAPRKPVENAAIGGGPLRLYVFWATYCAPCKVILNDLARAFDVHNNVGIEIVAVSTDADMKALESFLAQNPDWKFRVAHLPMSAYQAIFPPGAQPRVFLVNRDDVVVWEMLSQRSFLADLEAALKTLDRKP